MALTVFQPCTGANTVAVSTANATYPLQWDSVPITGVGTTATWDNAHSAHGYPTAMKLHYPASVAASVYSGWKAALTGSPFANAYVRAYVYMTAYPTVVTRLCSLLSGAGVSCGALQVTTTGQIRTVNSAGTTVLTSVGVMPLNALVRFEFDITGISGATGTMNGRFYSGVNLEGSTPDTNGSLTSAGVGVTGTVNEVRYSSSSAVTETSAWDIWYQDAAFSDTAQAPPIGVRRPPLTIRQAVSRASSW